MWASFERAGSSLPGLRALNQELATLYGGGKNTANVEAAFHATDLSALVGSPCGRIPIGVERARAWLDIERRRRAPEGLGDDPNDAGAAAIAAAFERRIDSTGECSTRSRRNPAPTPL